MSVGDASPGTAYRLPGRAWEGAAASGDMMAVHALRTVAGGQCEPLFYLASGGDLAVDVASSSATWTGLASNVPMAEASLSTRDSGPSQTCSNLEAVAWFYGDCCSNCPTFGDGLWSDEPHPTVDYTATEPDIFGRVSGDVCGGDETIKDVLSGSLEGADTMEFYLR